MTWREYIVADEEDDTIMLILTFLLILSIPMLALALAALHKRGCFD